MTEPRDLKNGWAEWECLGCGQTILFRKRESMHIVVNKAGKVEGIVCVPCHRKHRKSRRGSVK